MNTPLIAFSPAMREEHLALKRLLRTALYEHPQVLGMAERSRQIVTALFSSLMTDGHLWPGNRGELPAGTRERAQAVADYLAGMTDRYAISEHARLQHGDANQGP